MTARTGVVIQIVLYQSTGGLPRLLRALDLLDVGDLEISIRILDNSPGSGAEAVVREWRSPHPIAFHDSPRGNIGFGAGHNHLFHLALESGESPDFVLLLNPDTVPFHDVVLRLAESGRARPAAALVEAAQFPVEHQKEFDVATGHTRWCSAACLLVRARSYRELGGFDERLFMYCEDVDLSWRAWAAGWECLYAPTARCVHVSQAEDVGKDRGVELHHMALGDLYLRRKWFDEREVAAHVEHVRVWLGEDVAASVLVDLERISPPTPPPARPPQAVLMPDHINYAPARW